ncbi:MAG: hypothetical protein WCP45_17240 [Verrucomicrobiota bacterium]
MPTTVLSGKPSSDCQVRTTHGGVAAASGKPMASKPTSQSTGRRP